MSTELNEWLLHRLNDEGWTIRELARRAGLAHATINGILAEKSNPGPDFCNGIAKALKVPPDRVFRLAGLLPPVIIGKDEEQEYLDYIRYLSTEERHSVLTLARALYEQRAEYVTEREKE